MSGTNEQEGVIKFDLQYSAQARLPVADTAVLALNGWRTICRKLGLIGQDPARYDGYGFGNISQRIGSGNQFLISGTQTGQLARLTRDDFALVTACDPPQNRVWAVGPVKPSSESMTHAILYALDMAIGAVIHVHSPEIWHTAVDLDLPQTAPDVPYGTPAMSAEVQHLFATTAVGTKGIFSMGGHEDGVVAFGDTLDTAGTILISTLVQADMLSQ
jgi:hypothetical protein